ncbi:hypothetical protein DES47_11561 [Roseateles toxinivorans]|uniref:Uncharacterized protein n=1 Tax=Roseateles toxinivorans TaxID=270368 RepID=A0A4R6QGH5_9BURK|nr:hypothetical protein DES47_11561 [Roseateles toxinivorans]
MPSAVIDSYVFEQAKKLAKKEMSVYHDARDRAHREAIKGITLLQGSETTTREKPKSLNKKK